MAQRHAKPFHSNTSTIHEYESWLLTRMSSHSDKTQPPLGRANILKKQASHPWTWDNGVIWEALRNKEVWSYEEQMKNGNSNKK